MAKCFIFGRFQPPHIEHIYNILRISRKEECEQIIVGVVGFFREGEELINYNNPISLRKRASYLENILKDIDRISLESILLNNTLIDPIKWIIKRWILDRNEYIIFTSDIHELFIYKIFSLLFRSFGMKIKAEYLGGKNIAGSKIREMIKNNNNEWERYVILDNYFKQEIYKYIKEQYENRKSSILYKYALI